jgi:hypothetical protein
MQPIQKVNISHTINRVALSFINVYVPAFLLTLGFSLSEVIFYFAVSHVTGLLVTLFLYVPLMKKIGIITLFKLNYPLQILYLFLLFFLQEQSIPLWIIALLYGAANYAYWIPLNLLFIRHSAQEEMGSNFAKFFALPGIFSIIGPLIGAVLIPFIGFWPVFVISAIGLVLSFLPLASVAGEGITVSLHFSKAWKRISRNKFLFVLEGFDNVIEESEWFWGIYVFLIIGSLSTPGIIGSLEAIGGALFTLLVGKYANRHGKKFIPIATILLMGVSVSRLLIADPLPAYIITVAASFIMTLFLVSYFSTIYKTVKDDDEEEFIILREIPTVLGRMVVFGGILLTATNPRLFFLVPLVFTVLLLLIYNWKRKNLVG